MPTNVWHFLLALLCCHVSFWLSVANSQRYQIEVIGLPIARHLFVNVCRLLILTKLIWYVPLCQNLTHSLRKTWEEPVRWYCWVYTWVFGSICCQRNFLQHVRHNLFMAGGKVLCGDRYAHSLAVGQTERWVHGKTGCTHSFRFQYINS